MNSIWKAGNNIVDSSSDTKIKSGYDIKVIYKYPLEITDNQVIELPKRHQILTAQLQNGKLQLWALVYPEFAKIKKLIHIYGTGHKIPADENLKYISTIQTEGGVFVWHIFEYTENLLEEM